MNSKSIPTQYHLEIYEGSFINDPTAVFTTATPFMGFSIGDFFDPRSLIKVNPDVPEGYWWQITAIVHRVWEIESSNLAHQVGLCVVAAPRP